MDDRNVQKLCGRKWSGDPCEVCDNVCYCHGDVRCPAKTNLPINWCCTANFVHGGNLGNQHTIKQVNRNQQSFSIYGDTSQLNRSSDKPNVGLRRDELLWRYHRYQPCYCVTKEQRPKRRRDITLSTPHYGVTTYRAHYGPNLVKKPKVINENT